MVRNQQSQADMRITAHMQREAAHNSLLALYDKPASGRLTWQTVEGPCCSKDATEALGYDVAHTTADTLHADKNLGTCTYIVHHCKGAA